MSAATEGDERESREVVGNEDVSVSIPEDGPDCQIESDNAQAPDSSARFARLLEPATLEAAAQDAFTFFESYVTDDSARSALQDLQAKLRTTGRDDLAELVAQTRSEGTAMLAELQEENAGLLAELRERGTALTATATGGDGDSARLSEEGRRLLSQHQERMTALHGRLQRALAGLGGDAGAAELRTTGLKVIDDLTQHRTTQRLMEHAQSWLQSDEMKQYVSGLVGSAGSALSAAEGSKDEYARKVVDAVRNYAKDPAAREFLAKSGEYLGRAEISEIVKTAAGSGGVGGYSEMALQWLDSSEKYVDTLDSSRPELLARGNEMLLSGARAAQEALDGLDPDELAERGRRMASDPEERARLVAKVRETAITYVLDQLPSIKVPPIDGVKDRVAFQISKLDMSGFRIQRENVTVSLGDYRATGHILHVHVRDITAAFRGLEWHYEQQYFPYMQGTGSADADVTGGSITLDLSLRRREGAAGAPDRTELVVARFATAMASIDLRVGESALSSVYNVLASLFTDTVRMYVTRSVTDSLQGNMSLLLQRVNDLATPFWPMILSLAGVSADALERVREEEATVSLEGTAAGADLAPGEYEHTFHDQGSLGMTLDNDTSGGGALFVAAFSRLADGTVGPAERAGTISVGDSIIAVNGHSVANFTVPAFVKAFRSAGRPVTIRFFSAESAGAEGRRWAQMKSVGVEFLPGPVGMVVKSRSPDSSAYVAGFQRRRDGSLGPAEASGAVRPFDVLLSINARKTLDLTFDQTMHLFKTAARPVRIEFARSSDLQVSLNAARRPVGLRLDVLPTTSAPAADTADTANTAAAAEAPAGEAGPLRVGAQARCVATGFRDFVVAARAAGVIAQGHLLVAVQGTDVTAMPYDDVLALLRVAPRPCALDFRSPVSDAAAGEAGAEGEDGSEEEEAFTVDLTAPTEASPRSGAAAAEEEAAAAGECARYPGLYLLDRTARQRRAEAAEQPGRRLRVIFGEGPFGCVFARSADGRAFVKGISATKGAAELCGDIVVGDVILAVGNTSVEGLSLSEIQELLAAESGASPDAVRLTLRDMDQHQRIWPDAVRSQAIAGAAAAQGATTTTTPAAE